MAASVPKFAQGFQERLLPRRGALVRGLALWALLGLGCSFELGLLLGKSLWRTPFSLMDASKWVPFMFLLLSILQVWSHMNRILEGAYQTIPSDQTQAEAPQINGQR
jgi:hypothetical protein